MCSFLADEAGTCLIDLMLFLLTLAVSGLIQMWRDSALGARVFHWLLWSWHPSAASPAPLTSLGRGVSAPSNFRNKSFCCRLPFRSIWHHMFVPVFSPWVQICASLNCLTIFSCSDIYQDHIPDWLFQRCSLQRRLLITCIPKLKKKW